MALLLVLRVFGSNRVYSRVKPSPHPGPFAEISFENQTKVKGVASILKTQIDALSREVSQG